MRPNTLGTVLARTRKTRRGCWIWTGYKSRDGYGQVGWRGRQRRVHRAVYEEMIGPIGEGLTLDHLCRNRSCVNPAHLEPVSQGVNTLRGRTVTAINAAKTHCPAGHPYSAKNTYIRPQGGRDCRACWAADKRRYRARKRAAA